MAAPTEGTDLEASLLSFEKLDRASPDLWPEQLPGVAEFAASFKSPITNSPPKWMAELENDDIDMLKELGSLTTANLMEKVRGLQNLAYQLGLDESPVFCLPTSVCLAEKSLFISFQPCLKPLSPLLCLLFNTEFTVLFVQKRLYCML
ncbi:protein lin-52 homolog isoform X1 [Trachemys scripta elegans]|uniref:protein lin-52 homolog isoform X1 n=1 Tax=Trachemys scripta elegans TaxID=31138 RepID=UPI001557D415|nr:protein lin-52 homolog isoform X1 [Trachemys scripta elegans]